MYVLSEALSVEHGLLPVCVLPVLIAAVMAIRCSTMELLIKIHFWLGELICESLVWRNISLSNQVNKVVFGYNMAIAWMIFINILHNLICEYYISTAEYGLCR